MRSFFGEYGIKLSTQRINNIKFDLNYIRMLNETAKAVIVGGGGLMHTSKMVNRKTISGFLFDIGVKGVECLDVPLLVYSIGFNTFRDEMQLPERSKDVIRAIADKGMFTVRNDKSRERLMDFLGEDIESIKTIPDPGLWTPMDDRSGRDGKHIAIQIAADRQDLRFGTKKDIDTFIKEIYWLIAMSDDIQFHIVPHTPDDHKFIQVFKGTGAKIHRLLNKTERQAGSVMGLYSQMDMVIGQRGHANICPFGNFIPIICLISHEKNIGFMEEAGFEEYAIEVGTECLGIELRKMIDTLYSEMAEYKVRQVQSVLKMKSDNIMWIDPIKKFLGIDNDKQEA
jgi:polysaccharide pyruvyl transferase WcaK-like protein